MHRWIVCLALLAIAAPARADEIDELMEDGRWKEARAAVEALARSRPAEARTLHLQSQVELAFQHLEPALALAERAAALEPRNAGYRYQVAEVCGSMAQAAGKLKAFGLARRFKKEAEQALVLDPAHLDARLGLIEFYQRAPGIVGGSQARAAAMAKEVLARDRARGLMAEASLANRAKDRAKAEGLYRAAVEANPAHYGARLALAQMLATEERKQWAEAEAQARAALALDAGRSGAHAMIAGLCAHLGRWDDLEAALAASARAVPGNRNPWYQAARVLITDGREAARAERYLRHYLEIEPEPNAPTHAHAQWRLAQALEKQDRRAEAVAALESALKANGGLEEAKKDLKRLKKS